MISPSVRDQMVGVPVVGCQIVGVPVVAETWYFGTGVNTNNDFRGDPFWTFQFIRGSSVSGGNGEGYSQGLIVVSAEVQYPSI